MKPFLNEHYDINDEINFLEKDLRLPRLKAISLNDCLAPVIHIKVLWDTTSSCARFEMQFEEIVNIFVELISLL